jgi:hypothetical protein
VLKCHSAGDPLVWLESNHLLEKVDGILVHMLHMLTHRYASPLGEGGFKIIVFQSFWPVMLTRGSLYRKYLKDLIDFGVADKKRFSLGHFSKDASNGPDVNGRRVLFGS